MPQFPDPGTFLPHRNPFLFIDRITALEPGTSAAGSVLLTADAPWSPFLLLEAIAQLAGVAAGHREGEGGFLAAIDRAEVSRSPEPGDVLTVSARIVKSFGRLALVEGEVTAGETVLARGTITLGIGPLGGGS